MNASAKSTGTLGMLQARLAEPLYDSARPDREGFKRDVVLLDEGYTLWAPTYDCDPNPLVALEERILSPLLPSLAGLCVVDLACGTGRWLARLLRSVPRSGVGIDLSLPMLGVANAKSGLRGRLARADCLALPLRSGIADLVICSFAVRHIAELQEFARELARVMKPGAHAYVSDVHPAAYAIGWRTGFRHAAGSAEIASFDLSFRDLRQSLGSQGLERLRLVEARLGEPERAIFARAGGGPRFENTAGTPAIFIAHFMRRATT